MKDWADKSRGYISGRFPSVANSAAFSARQMSEEGETDLTVIWKQNTKIVTFGTYEYVSSYNPDGSMRLPGVPGVPFPGEVDDGVGGGLATPGGGVSPVVPLCSQPGSIGFTTQQMSTGGSQELTIIGGGDGDYTWNIDSGGGSFDDDTNIYTAPDTNENCDQNLTIQLLCNGFIVDSLAISVNAVETNDVAWTNCCQGILDPGDPPGPGGRCWQNYNCKGEALITGSCVNHTAHCGIGKWDNNDCSPAGITDLRTDAMKLAGCCPEELL